MTFAAFLYLSPSPGTERRSPAGSRKQKARAQAGASPASNCSGAPSAAILPRPPPDRLFSSPGASSSSSSSASARSSLARRSGGTGYACARPRVSHFRPTTSPPKKVDQPGEIAKPAIGCRGRPIRAELASSDRVARAYIGRLGSARRQNGSLT